MHLTKLKSIVKRLLGWETHLLDYRGYLFFELREYLAETNPRRILEIGPKDGLDTERLLMLKPERLVAIDLLRLGDTNAVRVERLDSNKIEYISANFMYSPEIERLEPFDCIWCTGVLYHNPEQLRMIRKLYDLLRPQGVLVIESATVRRPELRNECCVEIIYPPSVEYKRKYHISMNATHLPSASAIEAWLKMVGFYDVRRSECHRKQSSAMAMNRAAFLCRRNESSPIGHYYTLAGEGYVVGKAL